ncbi:MAG: Hsp20/alpha crystallin family protein [Nanoarchaeota archaeon]|nr:Hsp20/alpha crystallin family protein [Nanoarchaeota archaeon]
MVEKRKKKEEGIASEVLKDIGDIVPAFSGLIKTVTKTEAFKKRLKEVDKEIKKRLKVEGGHSVRSILPESGKKIKATQKIKPKETKKKHLVDVFDEKDKIRVVTELRNVKLKDIKINLENKSLIITAKKKKRTIKLPCAVKKQIKKQYKNGILEVVFKK